jgi:hypothetical protein
MSVLRKSNSKLSARRQINIKSVKDGVLALPGNEYRLVLETSSINFELKSEAEQDALIETYQSFLNSLSSALQIIIRAKELDMDKYLGEFEARMQNETEDIYRTQIANYSEFVAKLVTSNKILARHFYIVLPFAARDTNDFELIKEHLLLNADIVSKGLGRLGMRTRQLSSLEVLDLFYSFYNPAQAKAQPITDQTLQLLKESYL